VRVAIAQSAPVYLDKRASLTKAVALIQQAAQREAGLVAFGESWLPGYPAWLDVRNHHRKLVPTYTERLVWGNGDGRGLQAVSTAAGRIGGCRCRGASRSRVMDNVQLARHDKFGELGNTRRTRRHWGVPKRLRGPRLRRSAVQILTQCTYRIPYKTKPLRKSEARADIALLEIVTGLHNRKAGTNRV
jgi:hypothetical protein